MIILKSAILGGMLLSSSSCEKAKELACSAYDKSLSLGANGVAETFECSNVSAIKEDIKSALGGLGICTDKPAAIGGVNPVASIVCPALSAHVVSLAKDKIPEDWGCKATTVGSSAKLLLEDKCKSLIRF